MWGGVTRVFRFWYFFFSSRRRHTRLQGDWSSDVCSSDLKPRNARRLALGIVGAALVWLLGVWPPPVWWRDHWPRETAMMREGRPEGWNGGRVERSNRPTVQPTALKDISPLLQRSEEHTSELQSPCNLVCRLLLEK